MSDCKSWHKRVMDRVESGPLQNGVLLTSEEHRKAHGLSDSFTLTDAERYAIDDAIDALAQCPTSAATLRALLARFALHNRFGDA